MPVSVEWENEEQHILHMKFSGNWTWYEFYEESETGYQMIDSVDHTVSIILDFLNSNGALPPSAITNLKKAVEKAHPRRGSVVAVSKRLMLIKTLASIIQRVTKVSTPVLFANTIEEAHIILNESSTDKPLDSH